MSSISPLNLTNPSKPMLVTNFVTIWSQKLPLLFLLLLYWVNSKNFHVCDNFCNTLGTKTSHVCDNFCIFVITKCSFCLVAPPPTKASDSHQNNLIMRELLIMRESLSGRSWTSNVFNTVITLDTYQFQKKNKKLKFWKILSAWHSPTIHLF